MLVWEGCLGVSHAGGPARETSVESLEAPGFLALTRGRKGGGHGLAPSLCRPRGHRWCGAQCSPATSSVAGWSRASRPQSIAWRSCRRRAPRCRRRPASAPFLDHAQQVGFDELLRRHSDEWRRMWERCDVVVDGDPEAQLAVRFSIYHMVGCAHPTNPAVSIGARGLSACRTSATCSGTPRSSWCPSSSTPGRRRPVVARLPLPQPARRPSEGPHHGASRRLFPWESATPAVRPRRRTASAPAARRSHPLGFMEHHISADVAWAVWEYWKVTADDEFMLTWAPSFC